MDKKNPLENWIKQLQDLDKRIDAGAENSVENEEFMDDLNKILGVMSKDIQSDVTKATLKYINTSDNPDPDFACEGDSGFDLRANLTKDVIIPAFRVRIIPTGLFFEVEKGLEVQVRSRSGLAAKNNAMVLNSPGTIDSHYRGEVQIILANFGETDMCVRHGSRIAQGVVCPVYGESKLNMIKVEKLSETKRNSGGLGHTGTS